MTRDERRDPGPRKLTIQAELSAIDAGRAFLRESLAPFRLDEEEFFKLELALVEICVNITRYAYDAGGGPITLTLWTPSSRRDAGAAWASTWPDRSLTSSLTSAREGRMSSPSPTA
jgi:two-component sensor histidine kinase